MTRSTCERCWRSRKRASWSTRTWRAMSPGASRRSPASSPCTRTPKKVVLVALPHSILLSSRIHTSCRISTACEKFSKSIYSHMPRSSIATLTFMVISSPIISRNSISNRGHLQNSRMTQQIITTPCRPRCPPPALWCSASKQPQRWGTSRGSLSKRRTRFWGLWRTPSLTIPHTGFISGR